MLLGKLIPLYLVIGLGFFAGKKLKISKEMAASLLIYIVVPIVVFHGTFIAPLHVSTMALPIVFYAIAVTMCLVSYIIGGFVFKDSTRNLQAFAAGTGNTGYFAIPVTLALFGESAFPIVIIANFGMLLYESTLGLFIIARGSMGMRESVRKILSIPIFYAFVLGLALNATHIQLPPSLLDLAVSFRGAYTILGMMMIGLGLSGLKRLSLDFRFLTMAFVAKFVLWPLAVFAVLAIDQAHWELFTPEMRNVMIVLSSVPMAANTVTYATEMRVQPEKAATAVVLSTVFALFYIPVMVMLFVR